ncbi:MAG: histidinol-phosphate transaminase [Candidatus Omnitrophica bacterium]|nr:histidinol-phosphate transaminase [Candidatus Omnitrophota bacterium]HOX54967.1 histidinol-phosphate transaminase [Candidatus Omnitrophota bacterium]
MKNIVNKNVLKIKPYEPGKPIEEVERELGLKNVIKLASNENPLGSSLRALSAIKKKLGTLNRYPDGNCFYLKNKLAKKLGLKPQNLIFGNGSDELIDVVIKTFVGPDEEVLTSKVSFVEYEIVSRSNNRKFRDIPLKNFKYDLRAIKMAIGKNTKAIFIANPNNPTGTYVNKKELEDFLRGLPKNIIVVLDEAYNEFVDVKDFPKGLNYINKNVILLRTFSKTYGLAGLRIGYAIARPEFIECMNRVRQPFNVNLLAQAAALEAIDDIAFLGRTRKITLDGKKYLYRELDRLGFPYVSSVANFILIDLKQDCRIVFNKLLKEGVIVRPMGTYNLKNFIRVTIGTKKENTRFINSLRRIL